MIDTQNISFHESTVLGVYQKDDDIVIEFDEVLIEESKTSVLVKVLNVEEIYINETYMLNIAMETNDGEVLTLEINKGEITMIIEWNDFLAKDSSTYSYNIKAEGVSIFCLID